ncbi:MAG: ABC transporter substrate-binding protein [Butyricicoccus sp.]
MKKRIFAMLAAGALLLTGCGAGNTAAQSAASGAEDKDLRELTVVLDWYPNALHAFLYEAEEKGYFAEEGLTVNIQSPAGVNDAMSMVAAGKAAIGLYYQQDVIQARVEQDVPVKSIGAVVQGPLNIILSLKEQNITKPEDLVGKTIGYAGTELSEALVRSIMKNCGADASDVTMVDVGFELMAAMTTGNVDATIGCLVNHEVPQMEKEGFEVNYFFPDDYGVPQYYEGIFLANDTMIEEEPEVLAAFLRGCKKGFEDFKTDSDAVLQVLLDNQDASNFPLDPDVEKKSTETLLSLMETADAPFLSQTTQCWQENIDWMYDEGLISEKPDVSEVMATIDF